MFRGSKEQEILVSGMRGWRHEAEGPCCRSPCVVPVRGSILLGFRVQGLEFRV